MSRHFFPTHRFSLRSGFTLAELLVVFGVVTALIALLLPALGRARQYGKVSQSLSNLRQVGFVLDQYATDHNSEFPLVFDTSTSMSWIASVWAYPYPNRRFPGTTPQALQGSIFYTPFVENPTTARTYGMNEPLQLKLKTLRYKVLVQNPTAVALVGDVKTSGSFRLDQINYRNNGRAHVLFVDGHVGSMVPADVPALTTSVFWTDTP